MTLAYVGINTALRLFLFNKEIVLMDISKADYLSGLMVFSEVVD